MDSGEVNIFLNKVRGGSYWKKSLGKGGVPEGRRRGVGVPSDWRHVDRVGTVAPT